VNDAAHFKASGEICEFFGLPPQIVQELTITVGVFDIDVTAKLSVNRKTEGLAAILKRYQVALTEIPVLDGDAS
jgi:hypothetical protein